MWYEEAVFYHIYPLGLSGAPKQNDYGEPTDRLRKLEPWITHLKESGFTALYIGPLFESVGHGYETTDYRKVDSRLGTNEDLKRFIRLCHEAGIRVVLDGVFNHTGRDFFAFRDIREHRENSRYRDWYCNVNFWGNNSWNDGFSYDTWGGYDLLAKLNLRNPEVVSYHLDTVRFWIEQFDIDGIRLDAADVLDFGFMKQLRAYTETLKDDFWLMGEVIHGDYRRWVNPEMLHSVTNYTLHKALYSAHNDHNYFEIAHTVKRLLDEGPGRTALLYNFADNHDVERIISKLNCRAHYVPVHILLYTLPGIPSVYYGSEFGVEGKKERYSDDSIRPYLDLAEVKKTGEPYLKLVKALGKIRGSEKALVWGEYKELMLTTRQYAFARGDIVVTVNNDDHPAAFRFRAPSSGSYTGALSGRKLPAGEMPEVTIDASSGEIWIPDGEGRKQYAPADIHVEEKKKTETVNREPRRSEPGKPYEQMSVEELQAEILAKMAVNGPVTDRMKQDVMENVYRDSLLNWVRSFR